MCKVFLGRDKYLHFRGGNYFLTGGQLKTEYTYCPQDCDIYTILMDSLPIITFSGKCMQSIAKAKTDKGFCSTKSTYYYGLKLYALAFHRPDHIPFPEGIVITPASENDLNVHKQNWCNIPNRRFFGDKIYQETELLKDMVSSSNSTVLTPIKAIKNQLEIIKRWDTATNYLYSRLFQV